MKALGPLRLPPDYRMQWVEGEFRLFDANGKLLFVLPAASRTLADLERYAWQHTWRQIEREVRREVRQLRDGTLTIRELGRMRQYLRLLEALSEETPREEVAPTLAARIAGVVRAIPRPQPRAAALTLAGGFAAGLLAFVLLSAMPGTPPSPQGKAPTQQVATPRPSASTPAQQGPSSLARREAPREAPSSTVRTAPQVRRVPSRPVARIRGYVTVFGQFTSAETAAVQARLVRAKGYVARVVPTGRSFRVLGRIYTNRSDAERMARIFREIGLPARVQPIGL